MQVSSERADCFVLICGCGAMAPPVCKGKLNSKAIPLQAWIGPEVSTRVRLSEYLGNQHMKTAFTPRERFLVLISVSG
jgi:hypothetical protein